jgi:RNA polymerase sigma factor (TIGR02999 family)
MNSADPDPSVTRLLQELGAGRAEAFDELLPEVIGTLRSIAHRQLRRERPGHTLNTTALVNEAYLKLVGNDRKDWENRAHFFAVASRAMRHVLVSYARARNADKRGGGAVHITIDENSPPLAGPQVEELIALDQAMEQLERINPRHVRIVECRFFAGLTVTETAEALGVARVTVVRDWRMARAWLRHALEFGGEPGSE